MHLKLEGVFCQTPEKDKEKCGDGLEIIDFFFFVFGPASFLG